MLGKSSLGLRVAQQSQSRALCPFCLLSASKSCIQQSLVLVALGLSFPHNVKIKLKVALLKGVPMLIPAPRQH